MRGVLDALRDGILRSENWVAAPTRAARQAATGEGRKEHARRLAEAERRVKAAENRISLLMEGIGQSEAMLAAAEEQRRDQKRGRRGVSNGWTFWTWLEKR